MRRRSRPRGGREARGGDDWDARYSERYSHDLHHAVCCVCCRLSPPRHILSAGMVRRHFLLVVIASIIGHAESFSPSSRRRWWCHHHTTTTTSVVVSPSPTLCVVPPNRPRESNWEDDTKSSRTNVDVTDYVPPWRDHQSTTTTNESGVSVGNKNSDTVLQNNMPFRTVFATKQNNVSSEGGSASSSTTTTTTKTLLHNIKWPLIRDPPGVSSDYPLLPTRIIITVLSTIATWYLHVHNSHSPVLASSSLSLLVSTCLDRRLGQAALCGSFAGMCSSHLVRDWSMATTLGVLTSVCYEIVIHVNNLCLGIGGRLGVTAFMATSVLAKHNGISIVAAAAARRGLRRSSSSSSVLLRKSGGGGAIGTSGSILGDPILFSMIIFHMLGAIATIFLRESSDDSAAADPVRASSVVGLLGSLLLKDPTVVLAVYGGSFVGMSLPSRLIHGNSPPSGQRLQQSQTPLSLFGSFAGAGALAGVFHALTIRHGYWNGGWGGKAGLCAFVGCWTYRGLANTIEFIQSKTRRSI